MLRRKQCPVSIRSKASPTRVPGQKSEQFSPQTNLPYEEGASVTEEQLGFEGIARSALHSLLVSGLGWGAPYFTSPYAYTI